MGPDEQAIGTWCRRAGRQPLRTGDRGCPASSRASADRRRAHPQAWRDRLGGDARPRTADLCGAAHAPRSGAQRDAGSPHAANVEVLLLKGAGLAYLAYQAPYLRPRVDTDLLIRREALEPAHAALIADGWTKGVESDAELASTQRHYTKTLDGGRDEHIDLHWRVANPRRSPGSCRSTSWRRGRSRSRRSAPRRARCRSRTRCSSPASISSRITPTTSISSGWSTSSGSAGC